MDDITLIDLASDLGYELAMCGAETFRVEESISLVLGSYGLNCEVFAALHNGIFHTESFRTDEARDAFSVLVIAQVNR